MAKLNIGDLTIDNRSLGEGMLLTDVRPTYEYADNKRTDKIVGYAYTVALTAHKFADLTVKINGEKQLELTADSMPVRFEGLKVRAYKSFRDGEIYLTATAESISPAKSGVK